MQVMLERLSLNSKNSSKPPSTDPNRKKSTQKKRHPKRKPGGQPGREGKQLKQVKEPDVMETLNIDKRTLPRGDYSDAGYEARQLIAFNVSVLITEYRPQVFLDGKGKRYVAKFPEHVTRPIQYGPKTKASSVYMSQYQLIPSHRLQDYFAEQVGLNLSAGSICNFNKEAFEV